MFLLSKEKKLSLTTPVIMGILNTTPDSFYGKSRVQSEQESVDLAGAMIEAGAAIIDIGGQSTRPGSERVSFGEKFFLEEFCFWFCSFYSLWQVMGRPEWTLILV